MSRELRVAKQWHKKCQKENPTAVRTNKYETCTGRALKECSTDTFAGIPYADLKVKH